MKDSVQPLKEQTMRKALFFYWFLFMSAIVAFGTAVMLAQTGDFHWLPELTGFIHLVVSVVFTIGSVMGSRLIASNIFVRTEVIENEEKLNEVYFLWVSVRLSMAVVASLIASVGYLITSNFLLLIVSAVMIGLLAGFRPSQAKVISLLDRVQKSQLKK